MSTTIEDCSCDSEIPPTFTYHLIDGHAPSQYYIFWPIAIIAVLVTAIVVIPAILRLHSEAVAVRDKNNEIVIPSSYRMSIIIVLFPLITVLSDLCILSAPITSYALNFILSVYSSICLFLFAALLTQYLGLHKQSSQSWRDHVPPTRFYSALPCCCIKKYVPNRVISNKDFRRLSGFVIQFIIIGPLVNFFAMFPEVYKQGNSDNPLLGAVGVISLVFCLYGLNAIVMASADVLQKYKVYEKCKFIRHGFGMIMFPQNIVGLIPVHGVDGRYTANIMSAAYVSVTQCCIFTLLSIGYRYHFGPITANEAYSNMASDSYLSLASDGATIAELEKEKEANFESTAIKESEDDINHIF